MRTKGEPHAPYWITSDGGPIVAVPESLLLLWKGADPRPDGVSDYERACHVSGFIGLVPVLGSVPAQSCVSFWGDPVPVTWLQCEANDGAVVRCVAATDYATAYRFAEEILRSDGPRVGDEDLKVYSIGGLWALFDAAYSGKEAAQADYVEMLEFWLTRGVYVVSTSRHVTTEAELVLHRFTHQPRMQASDETSA